MLSESTYGRAWHHARTRALTPAQATAGLARRPSDLRHAALSLWLTAGAPPAQIAARAGHSVNVLLTTYVHCIDGQDQTANHQIDHALHTQNPRPGRRTGGAANRPSRPRTRPPYVRETPPAARARPPARAVPSPPTPGTLASMRSSQGTSRSRGEGKIRPAHGPQTQ